MSFENTERWNLINQELESLHAGGYASGPALERLRLAYNRSSPGGSYPAPDDIEGWEAMRDQGIRGTMPYIESLKERYQPKIRTAELGGVPIIDVRPKDWEDDGTVIVHAHGGAYTLMDAKSMLSCVFPMAEVTKRRIITIDYTTAPRSKWQDTTLQVVTVFRALIENGQEWKRLGVYGDSAGGGLMAGALLRLRDMQLNGIPAAAVFSSPWVDLTRTGLSHYALDGYDAMLDDDSFLPNAAAAYADPEDQRHPFVSAVYGDFSEGYPPSLIQGGTRDMLFSGFVQFYRKLDDAGQTAVLDLYDGMHHAFAASWLDVPEAIRAREKAAQWFDRWLA